MMGSRDIPDIVCIIMRAGKGNISLAEQNRKEQQMAERMNLKVLDEQWTDWKWQLEHRIKDVDTFEKLLGVNFDAEEKESLKETLKKFPLSITPYYMSLIKTQD